MTERGAEADTADPQSTDSAQSDPAPGDPAPGDPAPGDPAAGDGAASAPTHPGPASVEVPAGIREAMIAHARAEYPNEMCGIVIGDAPAADGGRAVRWEPARNEAASPYRYRLHPDDLLRLTLATWDEEAVFWAVVHSHVRSPAVPSPTDIGAATYPDALYVLVSLSDAEADPGTGEPSVRAWRIVDGAIHEVQVRSESAVRAADASA